MFAILTIFKKGLILISVPLLFQLVFTQLVSWQERVEIKAEKSACAYHKEEQLEAKVFLDNFDRKLNRAAAAFVAGGLS